MQLKWSIIYSSLLAEQNTFTCIGPFGDFRLNLFTSCKLEFQQTHHHSMPYMLQALLLDQLLCWHYSLVLGSPYCAQNYVSIMYSSLFMYILCKLHATLLLTVFGFASRSAIARCNVSCLPVRLNQFTSSDRL